MKTALVKCSISVNCHHDHGDSFNGKHSMWVTTYSVRDLGHYLHSREHGSLQTDMVLEKEVLHVDLQPTGSRLSHWE